MATPPIRIGSATGPYLIFESSSNVTTSDSGIQSVSVKGLWGDGSTVWSKIPAAGTSFTDVFGHAYLPSDFKVDRSKDGSINVEYLDGRVARVTFDFKRPDPSLTPGPGGTSRQVFVDSVLNYTLNQGLASIFTNPVGSVSGETFGSILGFPEPVVTVKYNSPTAPVLPAGGTGLYSMPGQTATAGFPALNDVTVIQKFILPAGYTIYYLDNDLLSPPHLVQVIIAVETTFVYNFYFAPNPLGWQLTKLKYDPIAGATTYDVEENWRCYYRFKGTGFVSRTPPN